MGCFVLVCLTSVKLRCHWKCQSMSRQQSGRRLTKFHFGENYLLYVRQGLARCVVSVSKSGRCLFLCLNIEKRSDRGCGWVSESPSFLSLCLSVSVKGCPPGSAHFLFFPFLSPLASYANLLVNADPHNEQRHRVHPRLHPLFFPPASLWLLGIGKAFAPLTSNFPPRVKVSAPSFTLRILKIQD